MNLTFWKKPAESREPEARQEKPTVPAAGEPPPEPARSPVPAGPAEAGETSPVPEPAEAPEGAPVLEHANRMQLENRVIEAISGVYDPEIPVNIYELGLIYDIEVTLQADVVIEMTLTSPACPVAGSLPGDVENAVSGVEGVRAVDVHLVWDPPWTPDRMSEAARLELGFM